MRGLAIVWMAVALCAAAQEARNPGPKPSGHVFDAQAALSATGKGAAGQPVTRAELLRLRPVVEPDLRNMLKVVYNTDQASEADLREEFEKCTFTPLRLGRLGAAILVEDKGTGGVNEPFLNIYLRTKDSYRRIAEGSGFGPTILPGPGTIPYLIYGGTSGVCYASFSRLRYRDGEYKPDACYQEDRPKDWDGDKCLIKSCGNKLPIFKMPSSADDASAGPSTAYYAGPSRTGREILSQRH